MTINYKDLIEKTTSRMNSNYRIVFETLNELNGNNSVIHSLFEKELLRTFTQEYPDLNFYHPLDNTGLADICCDNENINIELKCTTLWKGSSSPVWSNGAILNKSNKETFLFIHHSLNNNNELVTHTAYVGDFTYDEWTEKPKSKDLFIGITKVNKLCKQII